VAEIAYALADEASTEGNKRQGNALASRPDGVRVQIPVGENELLVK